MAARTRGRGRKNPPLVVALGMLAVCACSDLDEAPRVPASQPHEKSQAAVSSASPSLRDGLARGFTRISLPPSGEPIWLDIHAGGGLGVNVPGARRDVRLALDRPPSARGDYVLSIAVPRGGIQPALGPTTDVAPEDGWEREPAILRGDDHSPHRLLHYFVRLPDQSYARISLWVRTQDAERHARISLRTTHNPRGRELDTFSGWNDLPVEPPVGFLTPRPSPMLRAQ